MVACYSASATGKLVFEYFANLLCIIIPGRKCNPIWIHFDKISSTSGKGCKARCKLCRKEMQGLVERMGQMLYR